jgi:hypothetical protein
VRLVSGTIIGESIRFGAALDGIPLTVRRIRRGGPERLSPKQEAAGMPSRWTLIEFEFDDHDAPALASALADVLDDSGWYVDFRSPDETFVVFAGCVFRWRTRGREACRKRSSTGPSDPQRTYLRAAADVQPAEPSGCDDSPASRSTCASRGKASASRSAVPGGAVWTRILSLSSCSAISG